MIEAVRLTKRYSGVPGVENVSFQIRPGEILGYLGPNGSGKSTTVRMITGLLEPSEGQILFHGQETRHNLTYFKSRLGYVPEEPQLYTHLSGREYLQLVGRLRSIPASLLNEKIDRFLALFDLTDSRLAPLASYSKGMRQKVLLTAALLHDPELLILDEPFSGLDVTTAQVLKQLLKELARAGKMILYSSHVLEVVEKVCDRVIILDRAHVVADASVSELRRMMTLPNLEEIFSRLVHETDTASITAGLMAAMQAR